MVLDPKFDVSAYADPLISERAIDEPRPLKVIHIGAGISGILAAIFYPQYAPNIELVIYDKNGDVGGTWWENRYPGVACGKTNRSEWQLPANDSQAFTKWLTLHFQISQHIRIN